MVSLLGGSAEPVESSDDERVDRRYIENTLESRG
jgi:hypothetical protein